ncbi:hypothetical protein [Rhodanobacter panaciterrae]|nr:hypothetical protein [Rhodanobacter panaciterrae]
MTPVSLAEGLPSLGNVLYMPMRFDISTSWEMPRGLLVESIRLAPLMQVRSLRVASTITVEGPREWIECVDRDGRACARLHLLPDTDYLAWDALLAGGEPMPIAKLPSGSPDARPASAQLLRFHTHRLAGLDVLGGEIATQVSSMSRHLAACIARTEAVPWRFPAGG